MNKILHIPNYYPPHIGGIEDVCYNTVSVLDDFHHKVICFNDQKDTFKDNYRGIEVIRCGVFKKIFSQSISFSYFKELQGIIKDFNPDIIHFHTPNPLVSIYLLLLIPKKTKLIIHWHSDIIEQNKIYKFYKYIEKRLLKRADAIITTSPTYHGGSLSLRPFIGKLHTIANTINTHKLDKRDEDDAAIQKIKDLYKGKKIIFTFGRHVPYKGLEYLIEAAPNISDEAVIIIAGRGPLTNQLKKMSLNPKIHFVGRLSDDELRQYLHASDIFAFPSITRNEAFGVALAEAMYCNLPSVTFTILHSGVNWVCPNGIAGLESENRNSSELANAINSLVIDSALREKLGANAYIRVKKYFMDVVVKDQLKAVYNKLIL